MSKHSTVGDIRQRVEGIMRDKFRQQLGPMTSEEALECAIVAEDAKRAVGPFDYTFTHFSEQQLAYTKYAELLEKEENENKQAEVNCG